MEGQWQLRLRLGKKGEDANLKAHTLRTILKTLISSSSVMFSPVKEFITHA